jgi:hypothetical protein
MRPPPHTPPRTGIDHEKVAALGVLHAHTRQEKARHRVLVPNHPNHLASLRANLILGIAIHRWGAIHLRTW